MSGTLPPDRAAELEKRREQQRNSWRISTELGRPPSEAKRLWDALRLEAPFYCPADKFLLGVSIAFHAKSWIETRNPFHIDAAVVLCDLARMEPLPSLAPLIRDVAAKRLNGEVGAGTAAKIRKENARGNALTLMTILCAAGASLEVAASKAARQLAERHGKALYKASSLDKSYTKTWRRMEADRRHYFATAEGAPALAEWQRILPLLPDADENMIGERR